MAAMCTVHAQIHIPWSESDYRAREARGLLRSVGHYSSLRPPAKVSLHANAKVEEIVCKC